MRSSRSIFSRFVKLSPTVRRLVFGLVFYLLFFLDIRYFAYTVLGPWVAGITFIIYMWAWRLWRLVFFFMLGLFYLVRFYLIFLR